MDLLKVSFLFLCLFEIVACSQNGSNVKKDDDTINTGTIRVSVDETLKPLMEAEFNVFSYQNPKANLVISYKPEREVLEDFKKDSARAIIFTRELTSEEMTYFRNIQFVPRWMPFAKDGIAVIVNKNNPHDSMDVDELIRILSGKGEKNPVVVFDNTASSTVRWLKDSLLKNTTLASNCFAVQDNPEVIRYLTEHENAIGIIGNSWISDLDDSIVRNRLKTIKRVRIAVNGTNEYVEPLQSEIETKLYPLSRMVYCIQRDGKVGLGTGLQRFLYDEKGQLIVLKFGLMPFRQPERSIHLKEE